MIKTKNISLLERHLDLLVSVPRRFAGWLMKTRSNVIKLCPGKESLIRTIWSRCVLLFLLMNKYPTIKSRILYMLGSLPKSKMMTLVDKLNSSKIEDLNILHIHLLQILVQESILEEKACQKYWTPVYKEMSERLLLPTKTDCQGLDLTSSTSLFPKQVEESQSLTVKKINLQNRSCQKTFYQLSTSTVVSKWEKEVTKEITVTKSMRIKLKLSPEQKAVINEWINTSNYLYNKTIEYINKGHSINFYSLRDLLVTRNTKKQDETYKTIETTIQELRSKLKCLTDQEQKDNINRLIKDQQALLKLKKKDIKSEINANIEEWELNTPKDIRAGAIEDVCKAYKTAFANLRNGNISNFKLGFRKHNNIEKSIVLPKSLIKIHSTDQLAFKIAPTFFKNGSIFKTGKRPHSNSSDLVINNDCRLLKQNNIYWMIVPITIDKKPKQQLVNYCGVDPGVRTFMTSFGNNGCYEYTHNKVLLDKLNKRIFYLKSLRKEDCHNKRKSLVKTEKKKTNIINELHWKTINHLLQHNDVILLGNIKSHNIVKRSRNNNCNRSFNDLKFYQFKERIKYKADCYNKLVFEVNEAYTSQYCSSCGTINKPMASKIYNCNHCNSICDRDINAAKNILIKGIIMYL